MKKKQKHFLKNEHLNFNLLLKKNFFFLFVQLEKKKQSITCSLSKVKNFCKKKKGFFFKPKGKNGVDSCSSTFVYTVFQSYCQWKLIWKKKQFFFSSTSRPSYLLSIPSSLQLFRLVWFLKKKRKKNSTTNQNPLIFWILFLNLCVLQLILFFNSLFFFCQYRLFSTATSRWVPSPKFWRVPMYVELVLLSLFFFF